MATLQDLFNEIQADSRISNPPTFEEFQSKMEDPDFAERVNEILGRNGYDVNAYEGLKKKEVSTEEFAPQSQQESEQPSETTEPTQTVGTEPVEEAINLNEVDVNQFSIAFQTPEIEMPIAAVGVNPISDNQNQNVVQPVQNQVAQTQEDLDHPVSKVANIAKNIKNKIANHPFMSMSKDIALGTAAFSMEEDEVDNTLDAQADVDKDKEPKDKKIKRRDAKQIAEETGMDYSDYNYFYKALGRTKIYGVKTNADKGTVEVIYKNQDEPGSRAIKTEVPIGSATYKQWVEPQIGGGGTSFYDYNGDENGWEDLKRATLTVSGYSPKIQGQEQSDNLDINYAAHLEKTNRPFTYITNPVSIPSEKEKKDKTFFEKVIDYTKGKVDDVKAAKIQAQEYIQAKAKKRQEDAETYKIAEQTVQNTSYVTKADESFRNSPYNSSWTNDILEKYQIPISELLLDGNKEQILNKIEFDYLKDFSPKITSGDVNAIGLPGQELSAFAEETRDEYNKKLKEAKRAEAERLYNMARRDAQFHLAELAIMNQIEKGNKKFKYQDIERLRDIKSKGLDIGDASYYARNPESVSGQAGIFGLRPSGETEYNAMVNIQDAKFARNMIEYANSEYVGYYKSLGGMSAKNLEDKGISNDARALNGRKKELSIKISDTKKKYNIPEDGVVDKAVKGAKTVVTEISAIDKQIEEKTNQYYSMLIEENGQKVFKNQDDLNLGEKLRDEVEALVKKREEVKLKMNEYNPVLNAVKKYSDETKDAYSELTTIERELNKFGSDSDVKLLQDLSPTLELIESYDLNREMTIDPETGRPYAWVTSGRKSRGELDEFTTLNTYENNVEAAEKIRAENETWVESFGRGLAGGGASMTYGIFSTLNYFNPDFVSDDPNTWSSADRRKEFYRGSQEAIGRATINPAYEEWSPQWIAASLGSIAPSILGAVASGGVGASTALFSTMSIGNYAMEFEKAGYSSEVSIAGGILLGAVTARMESIMPEIPTFERIAMKEGVKKLITQGIKEGLSPEQIAKNLLNGFWKTTGKSLVNTFVHAGQETLIEETPQFIVEQGVMTMAGVRESDIFNSQTGEFGETAKELFNTMGIAAISGGTLGGFSNISTLINEKRTNLVGKQTQLAIATDFDYFVDKAMLEDDKFKESKTYTEIKNIKDRYDEMASNPKFEEFDDVAKGEILNANIELTKMMDSDKTLQSKGITDIKLKNSIKETQNALNKLFEVSQQRADQRNELNQKLEGLGVKKFQVDANGKVIGLEFDEYTTTEEQTQNTPKIVELIEKTNTKTTENAVQKSSTGEVLQREQKETGKTRSEREGMESSLKGESVAQEGGKEEIVATAKEEKAPEQVQTEVDQVQQSTGAVINLNEDGSLTITPPTKGGQSKKEMAVENAKQQLTDLGYNVESRVTQPTQQEVAQEEVQPEITDEEFASSIKEAEDLGVVAGSESMRELETRTAQDPKKGKIVSQASRAVKALQSLFPNMNIVLHENDESYNKAMESLGGAANTRGQFVYMPSAKGDIQGAVHINLDRANARTIAHEVTHAALLKMFKGDGKVFGNFKEKLKDIAKDKKITITDKDGNQVETTWGDEAEKLSSRYETEDQAEEYLSELAGLVAEMDVQNPANKSILQKIAEFINNFILSNPQLKALGLKPISDTSSAEEVLEFFDTLGKKISRGEEIDVKTQINDAIENNLPGEVVAAGVINKEAISKSQVIDTPVLNVYQSEEVETLPVISMQDIFDRYDGKVTAINSDPTRVGELTLISGKKIFMYGGPNYVSLKKNISSNIGFATTQLKKVLLNLKYAKSLSKDKPVATLIVTQTPLSLLSNSYSLRYVLDAISQLPKSVRKSKEFKTEFFGKDLVTLKNAFGEKSYNEFVKKYSNIDLSDDAQMDKMIEEMAYKLADDNNPASFKARGAFLSNLLGGIAENKNKAGSEKKVGYYSKTPNKFIAKQLFERFGLNSEKLFYEIGEKSIVDAYMNEGVWGIAVGGFETDPNADAESIQSGGVKHPLFNAKFPGKNHFALNGGYLIDELFLPEAIEKEGGKIYIKKASQMLAGSMYLKGVVEKAEPKIELKGKTKTGVVAKSQMDDLQRTAQMYNMNEQGFFPKNADEFKINRDFEKFGLKAKRANATSWGPGSLYLVNKSGRKVNPFNRPKGKSQIDIDAEESPLYQRRSKEDVPFVSDSEIEKLVQDGKGLERERAILSRGYKLKKGEEVTSRINLNFLRFTGIPALSIHKGTLGDVLTYAGSITLKNVTFPVQQGAREAIAKEAAEKNSQGGSKKTKMAGGKGSYVEVEPNFDGVELSFNPAVGHLFVDANGRAVMSAEEVTFLGFKAYARGKISYFEEFEDPRSPKYTAPSQVKFAKTKEELIGMADDVAVGNTTVEEVGVPELQPEVVAEAINAFADAIEEGSTIEEATEEVAIVLENSAEEGPRKVTPPTEKTEPVSANKKEDKQQKKEEKKQEKKGKLSEPETIVAFTIAGNAKSTMDTTGLPIDDAIRDAVLEMTNGDEESADAYLEQPNVLETIKNRVKAIKAKTERELEAESPKITVSERKLLLERVKAEIKAALEGFKKGKKEGVEEGLEKAQKTIDALNKKLEEGKITKQELQDRIKELGYNIRWQAAEARLAGEIAGKREGRKEGRAEGIAEGKDLGRKMGKRFGQYLGYFRGLRAGRLEQKGLGAMVSEYIKDFIDNELGKKGVVSVATLKSIARRAATINNQKQLDAFISYLDKVVANKRLAEGLNEIKKLQKKVLNQKGYQYTSKMKLFAKFDMFTADGDLAFDMDTLTKYLEALRDLTNKVPNIGKMNQLFDDMYDINQQNQPADIDINKTLSDLTKASNELFQNTTINTVEDYRDFKRNVNKYIRAINTLYETGVITEAERDNAIQNVLDQDSKYDKFASQFQDEIDQIKNSIVNGITDKSSYGLWDSIKDWLTNSPNSFTENQTKLIEKLGRAKEENLMNLSLDDLDLLNQVVTQIAENAFVDEKNLRTLLDRAEIRGEKVGERLIEQAKKVYKKYSNPKNGYLKMMKDTLGKSVVFWESRLGMKENGAFRKNFVDPITRAVTGWQKDTQRILKQYEKAVGKLRSTEMPLLKKTVKFDKYKLDSEGNLIKDGKVKVSRNAYTRVYVGVVGHILDNAWNAKQKKKNVNDWLYKLITSPESRNAMSNEDVAELDIVTDIYNELLDKFSDGDGGLDHMAILEAFENNPSSVMNQAELKYYEAAREALQEAGEYINSANGIRNKQHELNPYFMPRQNIGVNQGTLTSTDVNYNQNLGTAIRSSSSYQRVLQVPASAIRFNVDRLVMTNVVEGLRDYHLTDAKRYISEVYSNARENAGKDDVVMLNNLKQLVDTMIPFALQKTNSTVVLSNLMGKFFIDALVGVARTPTEFATNLLGYALGNRSLKSVTMPFTPQEKRQTNELLSEFNSTVLSADTDRKVEFLNKKGVDGYVKLPTYFSMINKYLNNTTAFMRQGEWKTQFERSFKNITGETFSYEKHFVKEKSKYYDDMNKAASDADFRVRRIMKGGNKAEQRQFIQWLPIVKKARISADSAMAPFVGLFSGFINHDSDNLTLGLRKAVTRGEIKDGLSQSFGAYFRLALYPTLMAITKAVINLNLGDDDEKEDAEEFLNTLKTPQGWSDLAIFSAKQVASTVVSGKYAAGGRVIGGLMLDAAYTLSHDDRRQRRLIEDTSRELYFVDPIDFYDLPSSKDDIALQISSNIEPIIGIVVSSAADFVNDLKNKGREQVTLYDIYEWTQQTEEGKQWMYMANSLLTLGQFVTMSLNKGGIPFVDDYIRIAEDELSKKEKNENTLYQTPGGEVIDMRDLFLDDSQRLPINIAGISTRERDKFSILATDKFNKAIEKEGGNIKGLFPDEKFLYMEYLADKAKYDAGVELGFSGEKWSDQEGEMVSKEPISPLERDDLPESEVTMQRLHNEILKGKQLSFVQNIKQKRKAEDYMFKELDNNPTLKEEYKNATIGGKLGVREYFKAKYLYDKYKLSEEPIESNYFIRENGKIKQVESTPQEEN